jgi:hypothetical protein
MHAGSEAARRRVVHDALPLNAGDVWEWPRRHDGGFMAAHDGAVAQEPDSGEHVIVANMASHAISS